MRGFGILFVFVGYTDTNTESDPFALKCPMIILPMSYLYIYVDRECFTVYALSMQYFFIIHIRNKCNRFLHAMRLHVRQARMPKCE